MQTQRFFASDNASSVHPLIMEALVRANSGHALSYGDDPITHRAEQAFRDTFGDDIDVYFVYNGTAANVLGLQALTRPYNGIICTSVAHINEDECGAPERLTGCKLLTVDTVDGRVTVDQIRHFVEDLGNEHRSQPAVVSITQATEVGTVYRADDVRAIADFAHRNGMFLHMDGARIANAAVFLQSDLRAITRDLGVDVLSFGGTKNGLMFGEAVVFFRSDPTRGFTYTRKQGMQLASKMRFIAAQFDTYIRERLWNRNADHANRMARRLADALSDVEHVEVAYPVEANGVFARVPSRIVEQLRSEQPFYDWDRPSPNETMVRWMASFDTTESDVDNFAAVIKRHVEKGL